jgi:hypothetical protein
MPEHLFGVSFRPFPVPHSFEQPFCADIRCTCQAHRQEVVRLFVTILEGRTELEPAAALLTENGKERHA